jgi:hypothetical protein
VEHRSIFNSPTVLEVSHLCYMKDFCELCSWVSTKALVNIRYLTINTQSNRVVIISSVITRIFLTLCNAGRSHLNVFQYRHSWFIFMLCIVLVCQLHYLLFYCCSICFVVVRLFICLLFILSSTFVSFDYFVQFNFHCSLFMRKYFILILDCIPGILIPFPVIRHHLCRSNKHHASDCTVFVLV